MKIALLRVGADSGNLGFHSPLFKDGTFDFIPINESATTLVSKNFQTYQNTRINKKEFLINYFPDRKKEIHKSSIIHNDPEFETFTYGDPSFNKKGLSNLIRGDYLIFYSSLFDFPKKENSITQLYAIGYFEIDKVKVITDTNEYKGILNDFGNNFHVKNKKIFERDVNFKKNRGLKLVKGTNKSKLLKNAELISNKIPFGKDNQDRFVVSKDMQEIFGDFGGRICIQRNSLRFIDEKFVGKTLKWIKSLT